MWEATGPARAFLYSWECWDAEAGKRGGEEQGGAEASDVRSRIQGAPVHLDFSSFLEKPFLRALCNAGITKKIFISHLGKFPRNPENSREAFFRFLINMFPLAFKTD